MPVTLSQIANNTASVTFTIKLQAEDGTTAEEIVHVTYFPARITEKTYAQLHAMASITEETLGSGMASFNSVLASLIKSWDVYEDAAQTVMFPLVPDRLAELPIVFRTQVISAILADIRPEAMALQA